MTEKKERSQDRHNEDSRGGSLTWCDFYVRVLSLGWEEHLGGLAGLESCRRGGEREREIEGKRVA